MSSDSGAARAAVRGTPRLVDLSLTVSTGMPTHAAFPPPVIVRYSDHDASLALNLGTPDDPHTSAVNYITMLDHVGTHVDAPLHVSPTGAAIDELPLSTFTGSAVCLDVRHVPDLGDIDVHDLERAEANAGVTVAGHIVLICSGFHRRRWVDSPDIFSDDAEWAARSREVLTTNPGLTAAATEWLADRGSRVHGVEGPSTDKAGTSDYPSHRVCRDRGLIHYEWLVNLEELLRVGEFRFTGYPIKWKGGTGSPVRAVAEVWA
jgi:kynurenine formamidase